MDTVWTIYWYSISALLVMVAFDLNTITLLGIIIVIITGGWRLNIRGITEIGFFNDTYSMLLVEL